MTFNTTITPLTIAGLEITDMYHISDMSVPHAIVKDIVFPQAFGRRYMVVTGAMDDGTSFGVSFASDGSLANEIYAETYNAFTRKIEQINEHLLRYPVGSLHCYLFPNGVENMRFEFMLTGAPRPRSRNGAVWIHQQFTLNCSQYRV